MADPEPDDLPSKRLCLSPSVESSNQNYIFSTSDSKLPSGIDRDENLDSYIAFSGTFSGEFDKSRDQNGVSSIFQTSSDLSEHGCEDFPSCFSVEDDLDDIDEHHFQPIAGPMGWVQRQIDLGISPRDILSYMVPHARVPPNVSNSTLWKIVIDILTEPTKRQKLPNVNTLDDVVRLIKKCKNIIVLTGAGVSVSCGIPDFRSRDGIYAKLSVEYPDLPDPQAMFDITYFNQNPKPFFKFAKEIYPGQFKPSLCHRFIHQLEEHGHLLRNYSQNIDTLEQVAGITRVIQCHGSFSTASCMRCKHKVPCEAIKEDIFRKNIPVCSTCSPDEEFPSIMKPDIVFFGESLPSNFYTHLGDDSNKADLLIVIGSSLKVRPVALIPSHISPEVPQILINREPLRHMTFDVELLGDCDAIVSELCQRLGASWTHILDGYTAPPLRIPPFMDMPPDLVSCNPSIAKEHDKSMPLEKPQQTTQDAASRTKLAAREGDKERNSPSSVPDTPSDGGKEMEDFSTKKKMECVEGETVDDNLTNLLISDLISTQSTPERLSNQDATPFIFLPPSRYVFYGAELCNSPLPSPREDVSHLLPSDDDLDSESDSEGSNVGSGVSYASANSNVGSGMSYCSANSNMGSGILAVQPQGTPDQAGTGYSSGDGSEGYGSGVTSGVDLPFTDIKGGQGRFDCPSEENTAMSTADDLAPETTPFSITDTGCPSAELDSELGLDSADPFSSVQLFPNTTETDNFEDNTAKQDFFHEVSGNVIDTREQPSTIESVEELSQ